MKNSMKSTLIYLILILLLLTPIDSFAKNNMTMQEYSDSPDYFYTRFKACDVQRNTENGVITFKNEGSDYYYGKTDTNTYFIDKDTDMPAIESGSLDLDAFAAGSKQIIGVYILKSDNFMIEGNDNRTIHIAATDSTHADSINYPSKEDKAAFERLISLGIMTKDESGNFRIMDTVSRSEMAKIIVTMLGLDASQSEAYYTDVPATHWAYHYIAKVNEMGVIIGRGDGTYDPDAPITYNEAIKMIVCSLGYQAEAEKQGGYPNGYLLEAASLKITNTIAANPSDFVTRGIVAKMINVALGPVQS